MIIPYITPKQQEIPKLLYKFRFLNRLQIQRLLHHKDKRRINAWLKDLTLKEYIEKVPERNTFESKTKLTVYRTSINGIRFLNTQDDYFPEIINKLYKDKDRSVNFINQCILLADIFLNLLDKLHIVTTSSDFINPKSTFYFLANLNPHLVYKKNIYYLLEVIEVTLPRYSIRKRIRTYLEFYYSNEWEDNMNESFPTIKFIFPTKAGLIYTKRYTKKLLEENQNPEDLDIQFTTVEKVREYGAKGVIWE